jgi:hypothetical protein
VWELVAIAMPQCNSGYEGKHMFANMSLGKRLTVSFTLVIALMAILASLAYVRINSLNAEFSTIITDRYPKTAVANEIKVQINEISRAMLSILIMEDPGQIKGEVDEIEKSGVGESGMGHYHGYEGFQTFSKLRPVYHQARLSSGKLLTPPYGRLADFVLRFLTR